MRRGVVAVVAVLGFVLSAPALAPADARIAVMGRLPSSAVGHLRASAREVSSARAVRIGGSTSRPRSRLKLTPSQLTYQGGRMKLGWSASHAQKCTLSAKPRFWSGPNPARVRCRGRLTAALPALARRTHWTFTFRATHGSRVSSVRRTLVLHAPPFAVSRNWAGYVVPSATPLASVSGQFTVPTLNCVETPNAGEAAWVGTGGAGATSGDLLQTGVVSECSGGTQVEDPGWWEEYPEYPARLFNTMRVSPGDRIEASVSRNSDGSWTTRLDDLSTMVSGVMHTGDRWGTVLDSAPNTFATTEGDASTVSYSGGRTAEWIVEDFGTTGGTLVPFADFGTVTFSNLATSLPTTWALTTKDAVGLGDRSGLLLAAPSTPDSTGRGFSVSYTG